MNADDLNRQLHDAGHRMFGDGWRDRLEHEEEPPPEPVTQEFTPTPDYFLNDRGRLVPKLLGDHIEQEAHMRLGVDGRLWRYVNGCYRPDGEAHARAMTRQLLGREVRAQHFTEVLRYLEAVGEPTVTDLPPAGSTSRTACSTGVRENCTRTHLT